MNLKVRTIEFAWQVSLASASLLAAAVGAAKEIRRAVRWGRSFT